MIISASRRTDIPALYPEWFVNRLLAGEVLVPDPYNRKRVSRIELSPKVVDCIVFWTKNPEPMLPYLKMIDLLDYQYYFEMTVTGYGSELEPNLPPLEETIATFILLSERIGKDRIDFRYDPIILNQEYPLSWHLEKFEMMCEWLHKYTTRCIISFVDHYKGCPFLEPEEEDMIAAAKGLSKIAAKYGLPLFSCAEKIDLKDYGIDHAACIDREKIRRLTGYKLDIRMDSSQRRECNCCKSIDIGMYDTCTHGCRYCYATGKPENVRKNFERHDPASPILIGHLRGDETVTNRPVASNRDTQLSLFDFMAI